MSMGEKEGSIFPLAVLNPAGRDPDQDFPDFAGEPDERNHAPVNFHAYAAATGGSFLRSVEAVLGRGLRRVVLLVRPDLRVVLTAMEKLRSAQCQVLITFKEAGLHQIGEALAKPGNPALFTQLCHQADGALASTSDGVAIYRAGGCKAVHFLPTPYPVEDARWDFSLPLAARAGIFIGTREFDVPSRNHGLAVSVAFSIAHALKTTVSVVNEDGRTGRKRLESLAEEFPGLQWTMIEGRRPYPEYLKMVGRHRLVFQWDNSSVPGQLAGDALLCGIPCVGGNGATERVVFPDLTGHGRDLAEAAELGRRLLRDAVFYENQTRQARELALEKLSFGNAKQGLREIFDGFSGEN